MPHLNGNSTTPKLDRYRSPLLKDGVTTGYVWSEMVRLLDEARENLDGVHPKSAKSSHGRVSIHAIVHGMQQLAREM